MKKRWHFLVLIRQWKRVRPEIEIKINFVKHNQFQKNINLSKFDKISFEVCFFRIVLLICPLLRVGDLRGLFKGIADSKLNFTTLVWWKSCFSWILQFLAQGCIFWKRLRFKLIFLVGSFQFVLIWEWWQPWSMYSCINHF